MSSTAYLAYLWSKFVEEFKMFATEGKAVDIAIGTILGAGVTPVANSIVEDIVMPPVGILLGKADLPNQYILIKKGEKGGPYKTLKAAQKDGAVTINYGRFLNKGISLIVILSVAFGIVKLLNMIRDKEAAAAKQAALQTRVARIETAKQTENSKQVDPGTLIRQAQAYNKIIASS